MSTNQMYSPLAALSPVFLAFLYPNSKYGHRYPIGIMDVIDNFKHRELREYYQKWYTPKNQCVIVVGDIDIDSIESKIKQLFGT